MLLPCHQQGAIDKLAWIHAYILSMPKSISAFLQALREKWANCLLKDMMT